MRHETILRWALFAVAAGFVALVLFGMFGRAH